MGKKIGGAASRNRLAGKCFPRRKPVSDILGLEKGDETMIIITDAAAADSLLDKYIVRNPLTIVVIAKAEDRFSPETVKSLLDTGAEIISAPKGASIPFVFGLAIGRSGGRTTDVYVLSGDAEVRKTAELMGFGTALQKKTGTARARAAKPKQKTDTASAVDKPKTGKPKKTETGKETPNAKPAAKSQAKTSKKAKIDESEPKKKPTPKHETVYADNSDTAGSKPSAEFVKAITKAGVAKTDSAGVWAAVTKSSARIVYDMQLRLNLLDSNKANDIYEKTKDMFDDLKKMTGGVCK